MEVFGIRLNDYGGEALAALFVILVFLGVWVPRRERDQWRSQALRSADQVDRLIESLEPMVSFIQKAKDRVEREERRDTGGHGGGPP